MRIRIVQGAENDETTIVAQTVELIRTEMAGIEGHVIVDENPDVIHILGTWEKNGMAIARQAQQRHIAVVYTPLAALAPWHSPTSNKLKLANEVTVLVASGSMEHALIKNNAKQDIRLIKNPVVTATTTAKEMAEAYDKVYKEAYDINEEHLRQHVADKIALLKESDATIIHICEQFLYAQFLYQRRSIPRTYIKELSTFMTKNDYDEDHLMELLRLLNLDVFTQQLEHVMKEEAGLTEGFMPVIWKEDKTSRDMLTILTDY